MTLFGKNQQEITLTVEAVAVDDFTDAHEVLDELSPVRDLARLETAREDDIIALAIHHRSNGRDMGFGEMPFRAVLMFGSEPHAANLAVLDPRRIQTASRAFGLYCNDVILREHVDTAVKMMRQETDAELDVEVVLFRDIVVIQAYTFLHRLEEIRGTARTPEKEKLDADTSGKLLRMFTTRSETAHARIEQIPRQRAHLEAAKALLEQRLETHVLETSTDYVFSYSIR